MNRGKFVIWFCDSLSSLIPNCYCHCLFPTTLQHQQCYI